mgnify:CR=1 FL=1
MNVERITKLGMERLLVSEGNYNHLRDRRSNAGMSKVVGLDPDEDLFAGQSDMKSLAHGITEKDKKKRDCKRGNKGHDELGRFSTPEDAASWAGGYEGRGDCYYGKWKWKGGKKKLMTRHPCGRDNGGGKAKYKCKDGELSWKENQQEGLIDDGHQEQRSFRIKIGELARLYEEELDEMKGVDSEQLRKACARKGMRSFKDFLLKIDAIERAQKGTLRKKGK